MMVRRGNRINAPILLWHLQQQCRDHMHSRMRANIGNLSNEQANTYVFGNPFSLATDTEVAPLPPRALGVRIGWSL